MMPPQAVLAAILWDYVKRTVQLVLLIALGLVVLRHYRQDALGHEERDQLWAQAHMAQRQADSLRLAAFRLREQARAETVHVATAERAVAKIMAAPIVSHEPITARSLADGTTVVVTLPRDPAEYRVAKPIARWMVDADSVWTSHNRLQRLVRDSIFPAFAEFRRRAGLYESALAARDAADTRADSAFALLRKGYYPNRPLTEVRYGGLLALGVVANRTFGFDRDPGGYVDSWGTPDKALHFVAGAALNSTARALGVKPVYAPALTCAGAAAFEWSQGHVSGRDIVAGCAGAVASDLVISGVTRLVRR